MATARRRHVRRAQPQLFAKPTGCGFPECERVAVSHGLCESRPAQWRPRRSLTPIGFRKPRPFCGVPRFPKPVLSNELCCAHLNECRDHQRRSPRLPEAAPHESRPIASPTARLPATLIGRIDAKLVERDETR